MCIKLFKIKLMFNERKPVLKGIELEKEARMVAAIFAGADGDGVEDSMIGFIEHLKNKKGYSAENIKKIVDLGIEKYKTPRTSIIPAS